MPDRRSLAVAVIALTILALGGCQPGTPTEESGETTAPAAEAPDQGAADEASLPPPGAEATARLNESPRHGEWVEYDAGEEDVVDAWVVYPERDDAAPVVVVIHEIFGLTDWVRSVADQLAGEGFLAVAPDLLTGKGPEGGGSRGLGRQDAVALIRDLEWSEVERRLDGAARYGASLPSASDALGVVGFCWGGSTTFRYATTQPELDAAVVYYGSSPETEALAGVEAPILGLYGGDDNRVNSTIAPAREELERLGKSYRAEIFEGAGHGFLRAQGEREGANTRAAARAWPETVQFFRRHLEGEDTASEGGEDGPS